MESIGVVEGTNYEEYFITDYENDIEYEVGEHDDLEELNDLAEQLERLDYGEIEHLKAYIEATNEDLEDALSYYDDCSTFYKDMNFVDVAEYLVDNGEYGEVPAALQYYIDFEAIAKDLECGGVFTKVSNGVIMCY